MGHPKPLLNSAELLALGGAHLTYAFDPGERVRCDQVFTPNRFTLQVHFEHLPSPRRCANFANIHASASLIGTDGLAISLGDCDGVYEVAGFRCVDVDARDGSMHFEQPVVTFCWPEYKDVVRLRGRFKVRFEVVWTRRKRGGFRWETERVVKHTIDTEVVELYYEGEETGGRVVRPRR